MNTAADTTDFLQAHAAPPAGMMYCGSLESAERDPALSGYATVIKRAWREMKLNGVVCIDNRPVVYLKEYGRPFTSDERISFQRLFWNQGVANVLVLADPTTVYIYSGLARPVRDSSDKKVEEALVQTVSSADYRLQIQSFYHALATGRFYEVNRAHFDPDQSVDSWLLDNLRALRDALIEEGGPLTIQQSHAFIGRVLFLCYLLDRGIVSIDKPQTSRTGTMLFAEKLRSLGLHESRKAYLYDELFSDLKNRFNGNMFDQDLDAEKTLIQPIHLEMLELFLGGHDVRGGQRSMGFWAYDFKMIPVETISAIYQDFLGAEDPETQRKRGAFYTPRFLAETIVDMAIEGEDDAYDWSFLDPACGSGIFLVILFNRLASRWLYAQTGRVHYATKADRLKKILAGQIRGVDVEETACRIACFSLYLAYLDFFDPPDIHQYMERTGKPLPKLLDYGENADRPAPDIPVIHRRDFFDHETLSGQSFDCIIGNPPWEGRGTKQSAQKFMEEAPQRLRESGVGCLLLPSKILQNQTDSFQGEWLKKVTLEKVFQFADYSFLLFQNALCPAIIARFKNTPPDAAEHKVEFNAPKFSRAGLRQGIIAVNPSARTWIPLTDILSATEAKIAPVVWKRRLWGTLRDQKLLDLLQSLPSLRKEVDLPSEVRKGQTKRTKKWIAGQGIKPWAKDKSESKSDRAPKPIAWPLDTPFVPATPWLSDLLLVPSDSTPLEERLKKRQYRTDVLYSQPPSELFRHPMVLVSQGFGKVAYCDFDVLFQHSLQSIAGPAENSHLLMFLAAYLRSNLARYFLFHTAANWGSERDKVHLNGLLRIPFPLPEHEYVSSDSAQIVESVAKKFSKLREDLECIRIQLIADAKRQSLLSDEGKDISRQWRRRRKDLVDAMQKEVEPLIYRYFSLTEQEIALIEDTIRIFEPSSTPTTWQSERTVTLDPVEEARIEPYASQGLSVYADALTKTLNTWAQAEGSGYRVYAQGGTDGQTGLAMVTLVLSHKEAPYQQKDLSRKLTETLERLRSHSSERRGTFLLYERDLFLFQGEQIHIVRPNVLSNWTRTAALNDAARIFRDIALAKKDL